MLKYSLIPFACLALVACGDAGSSSGRDATGPDARAGSDEASLVDTAIDEDGASSADEAPVDETMPPVDAGSPADAAQRWADALEARDWETARQVWGESGAASGLDAEEFEVAFSKYRTIDISFGEAREEGAAGTLYYEVPVTMTGELENGDPYRMEGPLLLSRVNDVPGASTEERKWHIEMSDLRPRPVNKDVGEPQ
ncbi:hypothetical protein [Henriciella marina]|uniref:hypothetical protein n=1 Tax=Henriciella marina TaxID=453851 RepID=UPI000360D0E0|nr:hypothetical protein [Henriciella marina]